MTFFKQITNILPEHPWKVQLLNGVSFGVTFTDVEATLKIILLLTSICLSIITAYFKIKKNGNDKEVL